MKAFLNIIAILTLAAGLSSCGVSPLEKEQRQANAFDISGSYKLSGNQAQSSGMLLDIQNESDRSNVFGIIDRGDFSTLEEAAFARQNISLNDLEKFRTHFPIGVGRHNRIEGGENISDDMGLSSRLFIITDESESLKLGNDTVSYTISATILKSDFTLRGKIIMNIDHIETIDGKTTLRNIERVEIPFSAKNNSAFFQQYMGVWDGKITTDDGALTSALKSIAIRQLDNTSYDLSSAQTTFEFNNENFSLSNNKRSIDDLAKNESPEIYLEFIGNRGTKIEVMGNIYSLGLFTGVISKIDSSRNNEQVGSFQFKRR